MVLMIFKIISMIAAIIWFIAVLINDANKDFEKWARDPPIPVNHTKEAIRRAFWLSPAWLALSFGNLSTWVWWHKGLASAAVLFFLYWLIFDGLYNTLRDFGFFYAGSTNDKGHKDPFLDKLLMPLPVWLRAVIKIGGSLFFICYFVSKFP